MITNTQDSNKNKLRYSFIIINFVRIYALQLALIGSHYHCTQKDKTMITVYHLGVSQSDRIVWLMEELGLSYKLEWFDRGEDKLAPPAYRDLHPVGTAPIIRDGDTVLCESAAICEYISQKHGKGALSLQPEDSNYAHYLYWMQFSANVQSVFFAKLVAADQTEPSRALEMLLRREEAYYQFLNQRLGEAPFLAGDTLSCADIMAVFNFSTLPMFGGRKIDDLSNVASYLERIQARPAYIKAMTIAGPQASRPEWSVLLNRSQEQGVPFTD